MHLSRLFQLDGYTLTREKFLNSSVSFSISQSKRYIKPNQNIWINEIALVGQSTALKSTKKCADFSEYFN